MASRRIRRQPRMDWLEARWVPGTLLPAPAADFPLVGDLNGDGQVGLTDEQIYVQAFGSRIGQPGYNPAADLNHNGFVGQGDGRILLHHLTSPPPRRPLRLDLHLAPGEQLQPPLSANSGGETRYADVTIVGRTFPNALVFTDPPSANYSFSGPAFVADDRGLFAQKVHLTKLLTNFEFQAVTPYGQQKIRAFPIRYKPE